MQDVLILTCFEQCFHTLEGSLGTAPAAECIDFVCFEPRFITLEVTAGTAPSAECIDFYML